MGFVDAKTILFNDGEGVDHGDLNKLALAATQRAWEWPAYNDLLPHLAVVPTSPDSAFEGATNLATMVFCKGGGPRMVISGLSVSFGAGFLGVYTGTGPPSALDPKMRWAYTTTVLDVALSAAPAGQKRFDAIVLDIAESNSDTESRDFKDATTGALSTTTPNKRTKLAGSFSIVSGTPAVYSAGAAPSTPAISSRVVALALVNDTGIEELWDCTIPAGPQFTSLSVPKRDAIVGTGAGVWSGGGTTGAIAGGSVGDLWLVPPMFSGDPTARVIGIELRYSLAAGAIIKLVSVAPGIAATVDVLRDNITALLSIGTGDQVTKIDLRSYPIGGAGTPAGPGGAHNVLWASGAYLKTPQLGGSGKTIALTVNGSGTVYWVKWYFAKS